MWQVPSYIEGITAEVLSEIYGCSDVANQAEPALPLLSLSPTHLGMVSVCGKSSPIYLC